MTWSPPNKKEGQIIQQGRSALVRERAHFLVNWTLVSNKQVTDLTAFNKQSAILDGRQSR